MRISLKYNKAIITSFQTPQIDSIMILRISANKTISNNYRPMTNPFEPNSRRAIPHFSLRVLLSKATVPHLPRRTSPSTRKCTRWKKDRRYSKKRSSKESKRYRATRRLCTCTSKRYSRHLIRGVRIFKC